ncbi:MAG: Hpt domain-containing protein [Desulfomonilaceae bacterium]
MGDSHRYGPDRQPSAASRDRGSEPVQVRELMDRLGGDMELLEHLLTIFLQDYEQCRGLVQGAIAEGDGDSLHKWAHRVKGALGNFAAHAAYEAAQRLEQIGSSGDLSGAEAAWSELQAEIVRVRSALESLIKGRPDGP